MRSCNVEADGRLKGSQDVRIGRELATYSDQIETPTRSHAVVGHILATGLHYKEIQL